MKYSLAVALLLSSSVHAIDDETTELRRGGGGTSSTGGDRMYTGGSSGSTSTTRVVYGTETAADAEAFNGGMAQQIEDWKNQIPPQIEVGGQTVNIDQDAVKKMMDADEKFFTDGSAKRVEDLIEQTVLEPLRKTELRIAANMAKILQPSSEILTASKNWFPAEECQVPSLVDCVFGLEKRDRVPDMMNANSPFNQCMQNNGCTIKNWSSIAAAMQNGQDPQQAMAEANSAGAEAGGRLVQAIERLNRNIERDFQTAQEQSMDSINKLAMEWAAQTKAVMVDAWKCDATCLEQTNWERVNPADFLQGQCNCVPPVTPDQKVINFAAKDFYTVTMEDWINIHNGKHSLIPLPQIEQKEEAVTDVAENKNMEFQADFDLTELGATHLKNIRDMIEANDRTKYLQALDDYQKSLKEFISNDGKNVEELIESVLEEEDVQDEVIEMNTSTEPETPETTPETDTPAAEEGGSGVVWWIVGILAVAGLGGGAFYYKKKKDGSNEGGENDLYTRFIDQETTV